MEPQPAGRGLGVSKEIAPLVAAAVAVPFTYLLSRRILVPSGAGAGAASVPAADRASGPEADPGTIRRAER